MVLNHLCLLLIYDLFLFSSGISSFLDIPGSCSSSINGLQVPTSSKCLWWLCCWTRNCRYLQKTTGVLSPP